MSSPTLSGWLLLVALGYATLEQGASYADQFRVVLVLVGVAAVALASADRKRVDLRLLAAAAGPLLVAMALSVALTDASLGSSLPTVGLVLAVVVAIAVGSIQRDGGALALADGILVCGLVAAVTAWIGVAFHRDPWGLVADGLWRGSSTITYANATGALVGAALVVAVARLARAARPHLVLVASTLAVGLLATGSRAAWLSVAVGVAVLVWRGDARAVARAAAPVAFVGAIGGAALLPSLAADGPNRPGVALAGAAAAALVALAMQRGGRRALAAVAVTAAVAIAVAIGSGALDDVRSSRLHLGSEDRADEWGAAVDELADHPVVGTGPGRLHLTWTAPDGAPVVAEFAHNEYLELLATLGLVGGVALAASAVAVVVLRPRRPRTGDDDGLLAALAVLAVGSALDFLWHIALVPLVAGTMVGLLMRRESPRP